MDFVQILSTAYPDDTAVSGYRQSQWSSQGETKTKARGQSSAGSSGSPCGTGIRTFNCASSSSAVDIRIIVFIVNTALGTTSQACENSRNYF
jgi:hypothetical protein